MMKVRSKRLVYFFCQQCWYSVSCGVRVRVLQRDWFYFYGNVMRFVGSNYNCASYIEAKEIKNHLAGRVAWDRKDCTQLPGNFSTLCVKGAGISAHSSRHTCCNDLY